VKMTLQDVADLREAISRSDGSFSSTSEQSNREQDEKTQRLEVLMDALESTVRDRLAADARALDAEARRLAYCRDLARAWWEEFDTVATGDRVDWLAKKIAQS